MLALRRPQALIGALLALLCIGAFFVPEQHSAAVIVPDNGVTTTTVDNRSDLLALHASRSYIRPAPPVKPKPVVKPKPKPKPVIHFAVPAPSPGDPSVAAWTRVSVCESGNHWNHHSSLNGYWGGLQFDIPTWLSNGGGQYASRPDLATKSEQIAIADHVYERRGWHPWPTCGKLL